MVFTMRENGTTEAAQAIEVVEGSHVFVSAGDVFKEWEELTPKQQQALVEVREILNDCFNRSMVSSQTMMSEQLTGTASA